MMNIRKKKKNSDTGAKKADLAGQRPGLQLLRQRGPDLQARKQIVVLPGQVPAIRSLPFLRGRERVLREVHVFEVGFQVEREIVNLRDLVAEAVHPGSHALRTIRKVERDRLAGGNCGRGRGTVAVGADDRGLTIDQHGEIVVHRLRSGELHLKRDGFILCTGIAEAVGSGEIHGVRAVPEQSFPAIVEFERCVDPAAVQRQRHADRLRDLAHDPLPVLFALLAPGSGDPVGGGGRGLDLAGSPTRGNTTLQAIVRRVGAREDGGAQDGPGNGGTDEDEGQSRDAFDHGILV